LVPEGLRGDPIQGQIDLVRRKKGRAQPRGADPADWNSLLIEKLERPDLIVMRTLAGVDEYICTLMDLMKRI
jgi:hypothetical protein